MNRETSSAVEPVNVVKGRIAMRPCSERNGQSAKCKIALIRTALRTASLNGAVMAAFWAVDLTQSLTLLGYLVVFGSWVGLSAYVWRLDVSTPAQVFIYNYANRVVAVLLAWSNLGAN